VTRRRLLWALAAWVGLLLAVLAYMQRGVLAGEGAPGVEDLPLIEVPAAAGAGGELMAVVLSGDGGWTGVNRVVARTLAARGIPVVGWNSLRYYRQPRSAQEASEDLQRIVDVYGARWGRPRVLLVGYSFGADALPFLVNRLPPELRGRVAGISFVALGRDAAFEFHPRDWLGRETTSFHTVPEVRRIRGIPLLCIYGAGDRQTRVACPLLRDTGARTVRLPGGHNFNERYRRVARLVAEFAAGLRGTDGR
jgi:type IV secretory pathway VirJ component